MFIPKQTKYTKQYKGKKYNKIAKPITASQKYKSTKMICLRSLSYFRISQKLITTLRQTIVKKLKKKGRFFINLFADTPVSKKPLEIRMGKGKGAVDYWIAKLTPGTTIIKLQGVENKKAISLLKGVQKKFPIKTDIDFLYFQKK